MSLVELDLRRVLANGDINYKCKLEEPEPSDLAQDSRMFNRCSGDFIQCSQLITPNFE